MLRSGLKKSFGYHLSGSFVRELEGIQGPTVQHRFSPETKQEGLAVASIVWDDPSTLPGDDPFLRARVHRDHNGQ